MIARMKLLIGGLVIAAALIWLGFVGFQESKAYYITIDEYRSMEKDLQGKTLKVAGDVIAGSIDRGKPQMEFTLGNQTEHPRPLCRRSRDPGYVPGWIQSPGGRDSRPRRDLSCPSYRGEVRVKIRSRIRKEKHIPVKLGFVRQTGC